MNEHGLRQEYIARINRVVDYIEVHLADELNLETLAGIAAFSPYHFHRIFRAMTGETLGRFIQRLRIERAANRLTNNPGQTITEIALDCGFSGSATFARAFRDAYGMSASAWRKKRKTDSNMCKTDGNDGKDNRDISMYFDAVTHHITWRFTMSNMDVDVRIDELKEMPVAYVRNVGPYKGDVALFERLYGRLMQWAGPRGFLESPDTLMLSVYHDDPKSTDESNLRLSVCVTVPEGTETDGDFGYMILPGGKYAVARFEINVDEYESAWKAVYGEWLPGSGYQPEDGPSFEICRNDPATHPEGKHIIDICIPVKPL